jgi:hypothetical protein
MAFVSEFYTLLEIMNTSQYNSVMKEYLSYFSAAALWNIPYIEAVLGLDLLKEAREILPFPDAVRDFLKVTEQSTCANLLFLQAQWYQETAKCFVTGTAVSSACMQTWTSIDLYCLACSFVRIRRAVLPRQSQQSKSSRLFSQKHRVTADIEEPYGR